MPTSSAKTPVRALQADAEEGVDDQCPACHRWNVVQLMGRRLPGSGRGRRWRPAVGGHHRDHEAYIVAALSQVHGGFVAVAAVIARPNQNQYRLLCVAYQVAGEEGGGEAGALHQRLIGRRGPRARRPLSGKAAGRQCQSWAAGRRVGWQGWRAGRVARSQYRPRVERHPGTVPVKSAGRPGRVPGWPGRHPGRVPVAPECLRARPAREELRPGRVPICRRLRQCGGGGGRSNRATRATRAPCRVARSR